MVDNRVKRAAEAAAAGGGGGYNIGGGYVTVGVDFSEARQEMAAFKQELGSYFAGSVVSPVGGGGLGAGVAAPAGGTQQGGAAGLPPVGTPTAGGFAGFAGIPDGGGSGGGGGGGSYAQPAGGGNGGRRGDGGPPNSTGEEESSNPWWMTNLFRPTTLFRQLEMPVGLFYGMESAGRIGQGFYQANFIHQHPEINAEAMAMSGSGLGLYNNPSYQQIIGQVQGIDEANAQMQAVYQLPLLGGYLAAFDWGPGSSTERNFNRNRLQQQAGRMAGVAETNREVAGMRAAQTGDPVQEAMESQRQRLLVEQEKVDVAGRERDRIGNIYREELAAQLNYDLNEGSNYQNNFERGSRPGTPHAEEFRRLTEAANAASKALEGLVMVTDRQVTEARRGVANTAAELLAQANNMAGGDTPASGMLQNINILQERFLTAQSEYNAHPTAATAAGATLARAQVDEAGRQLDEYLRRQHLTPNWGTDARTQAAVFQGNREVLWNETNAAVEVAGHNPQMAEYFRYQADLAGARADQNPFSRARRTRLAEWQHKSNVATRAFEVGVFNDTMEARQQADQDLIDHRPLTAQARTAVASAMAEVANAPKDEKETLIATLQKDLQTQRVMLTQQLGGQVAVDVNAYTAMGMPSALGMDLTGRQMDVSHAQGVYDKVNLHNARDPGSGQPGALTPDNLKDVINPILEFVGKVKTAAVSMFTVQ